ncbi:MAG TPA: cytochrome P450 [Gemmatimonadaceae bacterium]
MINFFFSDDVRREPFLWYDQVRSASPVLRDASSDTWILLDYASVAHAMDDHATFSSRVTRPGGCAPEWLVFLDLPRYARLRTIVNRAFAPRAITALAPRIEAISRELLDSLRHRDEIDLVADYAEPLPVRVIAEMMGIPLEGQATFGGWSRTIENLSCAITGSDSGAYAVREYATVRGDIVRYLADMIAARRASPAGDLLSTLACSEIRGEGLSDEEIVGFFQLLLSAATETTTNLISNAMLCFMDYPDQLARLRGSPDAMGTAIEEVMRFRSPEQIIFRQTTRDVKLHGRTIPADRFVLLMLGSANRDPAYFRCAHHFDVTRSPNPHIAFGHGIHSCLGAALARAEARVALPQLLSRLRRFEPATNEPWVPREALHVHGPSALPLRVEWAG